MSSVEEEIEEVEDIAARHGESVGEQAREEFLEESGGAGDSDVQFPG